MSELTLEALAKQPVDVDGILIKQARRKLFHFIENFAWPVLWPGTPFQNNWHIGAICNHLEAIKKGQIKRLIINMPFRLLKSTIVSQAFPAWEWIDAPHLQYLTASYAKDVATRDAVASRRIIESPMYQFAWGHVFKMTSDQNVKTRYENDKGGMRTISSTDGAATGFGGNRLIWDDPISAREADSQVMRETAIEFYRGTASTRLNNPSKDAIVIVHQRLNEMDPTGYILAEETGWEHLILPMRYEPKYFKTTCINFKDERTEEGQLLFPERLNEETVQAMERTLGTFHRDAQLQQRPTARGGVIFARKDWRFYKVVPEVEEKVLSVDCAFKDNKGNDYVAIHVWGRLGANKYLLYRLRQHLGFGATIAAIRTIEALFPDRIAVLIEDKANGPAVIESLISDMSGVIAINPEGGKIARAYAMQPEHEAGNIWLPDPSIDSNIENFIQEASSFPAVPHDDETDAMTQAVNWFRTRERKMGILNWMEGEVKGRERIINERQAGAISEAKAATTT